MHLGNWTTSTSNSVFAYNPISLGSTVVAPSGRLVVLLNHPTGIVTAFAKQTLSVVPGNLYQFVSSLRRRFVSGSLIYSIVSA